MLFEAIVTFKKAGLQDVLPHVDLQNILLETDCPYLAPIPYRRKRNEPSYLPIIVHEIAKIKGISAEKVAEETTQNATKLFKLSVEV